MMHALVFPSGFANLLHFVGSKNGHGKDKHTSHPLAPGYALCHLVMRDGPTHENV